MPKIAFTGAGSYGFTAKLLGNLFRLNEVGVTADFARMNAADPLAQAALLLCNVNSSVEGATRHGGFDTFDDRGQAGDAFLRRMLGPLRGAQVETRPGVPVKGA